MNDSGATASVATKTITAASPALVASISSPALIELMASSICGAIVFVLWSDDIPTPKRVLYGVLGSILGVLIGPHVSSLPFLGSVTDNIGGLLVGAFAVIVLNGLMDLLKNGDVLKTILGGRHDR